MLGYAIFIDDGLDKMPVQFTYYFPTGISRGFAQTYLRRDYPIDTINKLRAGTYFPASVRRNPDDNDVYRSLTVQSFHLTDVERVRLEDKDKTTLPECYRWIPVLEWKVPRQDTRKSKLVYK